MAILTLFPTSYSHIFAVYFSCRSIVYISEWDISWCKIMLMTSWPLIEFQKGKGIPFQNFQTSFVLLVAYRGSPWRLFLHFCPKILGRSNKISFVCITRVVFKFVNGLGCQANVDDSMTINRISIGKGYKVHSRLLVSKIFFQVEYSIAGQMKPVQVLLLFISRQWQRQTSLMMGISYRCAPVCGNVDCNNNHGWGFPRISP